MGILWASYFCDCCAASESVFGGEKLPDGWSRLGLMDVNLQLLLCGDCVRQVVELLERHAEKPSKKDT